MAADKTPLWLRVLLGDLTPKEGETNWQYGNRQLVEGNPATTLGRLAGEQVRKGLGFLNAPVIDPATAPKAAEPPAVFNFGQAPAAASAVAPAPVAAPSAPAGNAILSTMLAITAQSESGNRERDAQGRLITSPAGAQGRMQVMPATNAKPGYGVTPARNNSDAERSRVGADYLQAMLNEYGGDPAKAWAAYNWGPGNLDEALKKHGDNWFQAAPQETKDYVTRNLAALGGAVPALSVAAPTVAPGNTTQAPGVAFVGPNVVSGLVNQARPSPFVSAQLPAAPSLPMPEDMPAYEETPLSLLDPIAAVIRPKARDASFDASDRLGAMLTAAAQAAAGMGPGVTLGQMIGAAGGAGAAGFRGEREDQEEEILANEEAIRLAEVALAEMGFNLNVGNIGVRNTNKDRSWQSGENRRQVTGQNLLNADARVVQQILQDNGITNQNIGALNNWGLNAANMMLGAYGNMADAQNAANAGQMNLNTTAATRALDAQERTLNQKLLSYGLDPNNTKDPMVAAARATALALGAERPSLAQTLGGLSQELLVTGNYKEILDEEDTGDVEKLLREDGGELAALDIVRQALADNLQSMDKAEREKAAALLKQLADRGSASAKMLVERMTGEYTGGKTR